MADTLWIGTRKGLFSLRSDRARRRWKLGGPQLLGHIIHHVVQDSREPRVLLLAVRTGHLGPTVMRSVDRGRSWCEAAAPPAFRKAGAGAEARAVQRVFWLSAGHRSESGTWYAGSSPAGLFRSTDGGERWEPVAGFNDHPMRPQWAAHATPDGEFLHSILIDPRDPQHLYIAISIGGVFESTDAGASWTPLNEGCAADFLPDPAVPFGHDPHCVVQHPLMPDRLYQQNHCGIYRLDRPGRRWQRIGKAMPRKVGDVGFPIVLHPTDPDRVPPRVKSGQAPTAVSPGAASCATCRRDPLGDPRGLGHPAKFRSPRLNVRPPNSKTRNLAGAPLAAMPCTVRIASPLRSYTAGAGRVTARGRTLAEVLGSLEERCPGIRFRMIDEQDRIRPHLRLFVNSSEARELTAEVADGDTVHVVCALSGG